MKEGGVYSFQGIWDWTNLISVLFKLNAVFSIASTFVFIFLFDKMELVDCTFCKVTQILMPTILEQAENKFNQHQHSEIHQYDF